jgi:hypothetical protein
MTIRFEQSFVKEVPELKTEGLINTAIFNVLMQQVQFMKKVNLLRLDMWCFHTDLAKTENFYIEKVGFIYQMLTKIVVHSYVVAVKVITMIYSYLRSK